MGPSSVAEYCRAVEAHLTRVNGGHMVRIVGPGFTLVREWETAGIPLSVVQRAIDQKAERHRLGTAGRSGRPLRIEFCENDVQELLADWKRAVGVTTTPADTPAGVATGHEPVDSLSPESLVPSSRRQSLSKHLERVSDRLSRLLGRHDVPEAFLERVNVTISAVAAARDRARTARGASRDEIAAALRPLDRELMTAARVMLGEAARDQLQTQAEGELAAFRNRLDGDAWKMAVDATVDRLLRERFGLPVIEMDQV